MGNSPSTPSVAGDSVATFPRRPSKILRAAEAGVFAAAALRQDLLAALYQDDARVIRPYSPPLYSPPSPSMSISQRNLRQHELPHLPPGFIVGLGKTIIKTVFAKLLVYFILLWVCGDRSDELQQLRQLLREVLSTARAQRETAEAQKAAEAALEPTERAVLLAKIAQLEAEIAQLRAQAAEKQQE